MNARLTSLAALFLLAVALWNAAPCQAAVIKGTVTDSITSEAVAAAVVKVKGTMDSALTDTAGRFTLNTTVGIGRAVSITSAKIPSHVLVAVYRPDGRLVQTGYARELSALPDGMYLLAYRENGSTRAGKLVKFGTQYQTGPWQVSKATATVTLVFTQRLHRSKEQAAAEGDTNVQARLAQKKGWEIKPTDVGLAGVGVNKNSLTDYASGWQKIPAGSRISGKRFTGQVDLSLGNIIIERCLFQVIESGPGMPVATTTDYNNWITVPNKVIIRDCEFDASLLKSDRPDFTDQRVQAFCLAFNGIADVRRCYFHNIGNGIAIRDAGDQFDCLIEQNYVADLIGWGDAGTTGTHNNCLSIRDFTDAQRPDRKLIARNNYFDINLPHNASSAIQIKGENGHINNVTAQSNLLMGYGVNLWLEQEFDGFGNNMSAIDNRFRSFGTGESWAEDPGWAVYRDNYTYDPTKPPECKAVPK